MYVLEGDAFYDMVEIYLGTINPIIEFFLIVKVNRGLFGN
jgi:hypothetical protein